MCCLMPAITSLYGRAMKEHFPLLRDDISTEQTTFLANGYLLFWTPGKLVDAQAIKKPGPKATD